MMSMRRISIQIDEQVYASLRRRAFEEKRSIASIVRECLEKAESAKSTAVIGDFRFVGIGSSRQGNRSPVSENHDRALADALSPTKRRRK